MKQGHVVESSAVQQMVAAGNPTLWRRSITTNMARPPPLFATQSQLLLGGLVVCEEDNKPDLSKLENWEQQFLNSSMCSPGNVEKFQLSSSRFIRNNMLNFSPDPHASSKCNNDVYVTGGPAKKPRTNQQSSASHSTSTLKVKKEKLGDRITALHQLVSPFGKTDTASVLLEAIGYIKFLERQIESQAQPYLSSGSHHVQGERNCLSDSGQGCDEEAKALRSRGLCLVPISCTLLHAGNENIGGAPAFGTNFG